MDTETCKYGHELTADNLVPDKRGWRICRACKRARERPAAAARRLAIGPVERKTLHWSFLAIEDGECWRWVGRITSDGYGTFGPRGAHRVVYEGCIGPIPSGLELDHLCRNRACVNPDHLEPVTRRINVLRSEATPGVNGRKTHCLRGHEFTPENTYLWRTSRICRQCASARKARRVAEGAPSGGGRIVSAERLREAAALMRERATGTTPTPWGTYATDSGSAVGVTGPRRRRVLYRVIYGVKAETFEEAFSDATHVASWHPAVALAVADWLDRVALTKEKCNPWQQWWINDYTAALAVADAYLGDAS